MKKLNQGMKIGMLVAAGFFAVAKPASAGGDPFIGEMMVFAGNYCPRNWAKADGTLIEISSNPALFAILGFAYGGNEHTTFALPDLRGRVVLGTGAGPGLSEIELGQKSGFETTVLSEQQVPSHTHVATSTVTAKLLGSDAAANAKDINGALLTKTPGSATSKNYVTGQQADVQFQDDAIKATSTVTVMPNAGGGQSIPIRDPYIGMTVCIAVEGIFPSRN